MRDLASSSDMLSQDTHAAITRQGRETKAHPTSDERSKKIKEEC